MIIVLGRLRLAFPDMSFQTTLPGNAAGCCGLSFLDWWESALDGREILLMLKLLEVASFSYFLLGLIILLYLGNH